METWYEVSNGSIAPVQVSKVTEKQLVIVGYKGRLNRVALHSQWTHYYPTLLEAVQYLQRQHQNSIESYRRNLERVEQALARLQAQYPAECAAQAQAQQEAA